MIVQPASVAICYASPWDEASASEANGVTGAFPVISSDYSAHIAERSLDETITEPELYNIFSDDPDENEYVEPEEQDEEEKEADEPQEADEQEVDEDFERCYMECSDFYNPDTCYFVCVDKEGNKVADEEYKSPLESKGKADKPHNQA